MHQRSVRRLGRSSIYDAAGQVVEVQQQSRVGLSTTTVSSTTYGYRADGAREWWENDLGARWSYGWDAAGRLRTETDPHGKVTRYAYDDAGNLLSVTHPDAGATCTGTRVDCTTFAYDDAGQLTSVDHADAATPDVTAITYDGVGRRRSATIAGVTETWTWDQLGRLTASKDRNGRTTGYGWNATGQVTSITYPGLSTPLERGYDDAGRWTSVTDWDGRTVGFGYDDDGNWTTTTFPNASGNVDVRAYDRADRLTGITWKRGATTLGALTYTPDDDSLIASVASSGAAGTGTKTYGYNARDELTGVGAVPVTVDTAGNVTETEDGRLQVFDPAQQLCWSSPTATSGTCTTPADDATRYTYDTRGNRTTADPAIGASSTYTWDEADRLATATVASDDPQAGQYRPLAGARVADTRTGTATGECNGATCSTLAATTATTVQVTGRAGVPATGVAGVVATVTALGAAGTGTLRVNPAGPTSAAASVSVAAGRDESTFVIAPVDANGRITLLADVAVDAVVDIAGYYTSAADDGAGYHPRTTPALLANTATGQGICDGTACATATTTPAVRDVLVAGRAGVPATDVDAVALRFLANPATDGTLTVTDESGDIVATIAYEAGRDASDVIITPLAADGTITVTTTTTDDVRIDVSGWFTAPDTDPGGSLTTTVSPHRAHDAALAADTRATIAVTGVGGVPVDADTVVVSVTGSGAASSGQLRIGPSGTTGGGTTTAGVARFTPTIPADTVAIVPIRPDGTIQIHTNRAITVAVDIIAYTRPATETWTYSYDSTGLRTAKAENGQSASRLEHTWDRSGPIPLLLSQHETDGDITRLIYGPGRTPIAQIDPDGTTRWLHVDHLGSVRLATNTTGVETSRHTWTTNGLPVVDTTGTAPRLLLGYAGEQHDPETNLTYLRARYMDPSSGQFLSRDPLNAQTHQPYSYAAANPLNATDPTGLADCPWAQGGLNCLIDGLEEALPECVFGKNHDGSCRSTRRGIEMYADDAANYLGAASGVCAGITVMVPNPVSAGCAAYAGYASAGFSVLHTATTCYGGIDAYCGRAALSSLLNVAGIGRIAGVWSWVGKADGPTSGILRWCVGSTAAYEMFTIPFVLIDTQERPEDN